MSSLLAQQRVRVIQVSEDLEYFMVIWKPYDEATKNSLRSFISSARYSTDPFPHWRVPISPTTNESLIKFANANAFKAVPSARDRMMEIRQQAKLNAALARSLDAEIEEIPGLTGELRTFQKAGVKYALAAKRCWIADDPGLGKTVEALAVVEAMQAYPCVIVTLASSAIQWKREVQKWLPRKTVSVIEGKHRDYFAKVTILSYGILRTLQKDSHGHVQYDSKNRKLFSLVAKLRERKPQTVIFDEAHVLANNSDQTNAAIALSRDVPFRLLLTADPTVNGPKDLIRPLRILDRLDDFGGFENFAEKYCAGMRMEVKPGVTSWFLDGHSNLPELNQRLLETCMVRRAKKDVMTELPPIQRATVPLGITNRKEYEEAKKDIVKYLGELSSKDVEFLNSISHLKENEQKSMAWAHRANVEDSARKTEELQLLGRLIEIAGRGKLKSVIDWTRNFLESKQKLILYAYNKEIQNQLIAEFPGCAYIIGDENVHRRQHQIDRFQNEPGCQLIVCSLKAGSQSIELTAASNVAFAQLGLTAMIHSQAEQRCYGRIGDQHGANAWYLIAENTIEEEIAVMINEKHEVNSQITEGASVGLEEIIPGLRELILRK